MAAKRRSMAEFLNLAESGAPTVTDGLKRELPIDRLFPRQNQPRRTIDPTEIEQLAATIRALGMIQPIVVRPLDGNPDDDYEIVAGERRWRAAQLAGMSTVPAIIRTLDERSTVLYSLAENIARSDLNPMELAKGYESVLANHGFSQTELAEAIGQNLKTVNRILQLLKLPESVRQLIEQGLLTAKHGELILTAPKAQRLALAQRAVDQEWSVRELERQIAKPPVPTRQPAVSRPVDVDTTHEQTLWSEQLSADVKLRYAKTGKVQIVITVASLDEYQGIRERFLRSDEG
jgi:ParB family chromosome partitioning protein